MIRLPRIVRDIIKKRKYQKENELINIASLIKDNLIGFCYSSPK